MNHPEGSERSGTGRSAEDRMERLEAEVSDLRHQLEVVDQRLKKRSVERQFARKAADSAYEIVKHQNDELTAQVTLFREFVPASLSAMLDQRGFDVSRGFSLERTYSVLSTDIRNFTSFTEKIPCQECFKFLNSFFTVMEPGIRSQGGLFISMSATRSWLSFRSLMGTATMPCNPPFIC